MDDVGMISAMAVSGNIVIADESALHLLLNCDIAARAECLDVIGNPLDQCANTSRDLEGFNLDNPLYGPHPIKLLVSSANERRENDNIECRCSGRRYPRGSFIRLKSGLYVTSPELTYARLANRLSEIRLAEAGTALCGRYYLRDDKVEDRIAYQTNAASLGRYLAEFTGFRGRANALKALRHILDNSGSPREGKTMLQFRMPLRLGGFNLPFDYMNFDFKAGRNRGLTEQDDFCLDLVASKFRAAAEYDGREHHLDSGWDKRRRNALMALHWTVFPLEKDVLNSPMLTEKYALQFAKFIDYRIQRQSSWDDAFIKLRRELDLPV